MSADRVPIEASAEWRRIFPDASVGCLHMGGVSNPERHPALAQRLLAVQSDLRVRYASADRASLLSLPVVQAYQAHYRAFGQTYHVLRQLESVALKGRDIASPGGALVSAMFAAELHSLMLTAGHDVANLTPPLLVDCSRESDRFVGITGKERELRPGDMLMRDGLGIISAVLHGPDQRTRFSETTTSALFVTYAPAGIARNDVHRHLEQIADNVRLTDPAAEVVDLVIL